MMMTFLLEVTYSDILCKHKQTDWYLYVMLCFPLFYSDDVRDLLFLVFSLFC